LLRATGSKQSLVTNVRKEKSIESCNTFLL
jgi:hypothetical protein